MRGETESKDVLQEDLHQVPSMVCSGDQVSLAFPRHDGGGLAQDSIACASKQLHTCCAPRRLYTPTTALTAHWLWGFLHALVGFFSTRVAICGSKSLASHAHLLFGTSLIRYFDLLLIHHAPGYHGVASTGHDSWNTHHQRHNVQAEGAWDDACRHDHDIIARM